MISRVERLREAVASSATQKFLWRQPWCHPIEAGPLDGVPVPPPPGCGKTLGVTVAASALWEIGVGLKGEAALSADARAAESRAARLAASELGIDAHGLVRQARLVAGPLWSKGSPHVIEGPSLGLAMLLAHVSLLTGEPVPVDVAATGALGPDGLVLAVDGLSDKIDMLRTVALSIRRVLVPPLSDVARAELEAAFGSDLQLVPVQTVSQAIDAVFPGLDEQLRDRWMREPTIARAAAHRLYRLALGGGAPSTWSGVLRTADTLLRALPPEEVRARAQVDIARQIAARHEVVDGPLLPWDDTSLHEAEPERPHRLRLVAHRVQSAADHDDASAAAYAERALPLIRPRGERGPEDAVLLGAIGRALAASGQEAEATAVLDDALHTWMGLEREPDASRPLCERLRLAGVLGEHDGLRRSTELADRVLSHPGTSVVDEGFVRLALAVAQIRLGAVEEALSIVSDSAVAWEELPGPCRASRHRWLARALDALGRSDEAEQQRAAIPHGSPWGALAALDIALAAGSDGAEALEALARSDEVGREVARTLARCPTGVPRGRYLADHFRY